MASFGFPTIGPALDPVINPCGRGMRTERRGAQTVCVALDPIQMNVPRPKEPFDFRWLWAGGIAVALLLVIGSKRR